MGKEKTIGGHSMSEQSSVPGWPDQSKLMFRKVGRDWEGDYLLAQNGWFPLADVLKCLDPDNTGKYRKILNQREKLQKQGEDTVKTMGLKQYGKRLWADMPIFSQWFLANQSIWVDPIPKSWNLQTFLSQKEGTFSLNKALSLLPEEWKVKYTTMTRMITRHDNSKHEIGADRLEGVGYVVFMPRFGEWLRNRFD